jgi:uncharacterized membrane protein YGL010W
VYHSDARNILSEFNAVDVPLIFVVKIMITRKEIKVIESLSQFFKGSKAIVHSSNIKTVAIVMPITHKNSSVTSFLLGLGNVPIHKVFAVFVVYTTV